MKFGPESLYWSRLNRKIVEEKCWEIRKDEDYTDYFLNKYRDESFKSEFEKALFENDPLTEDQKTEIRNSILRNMIEEKDIADMESVPQLVCLFLAADTDVNSYNPNNNFALLHYLSKETGRNYAKIMDILMMHPNVQVNIKSSDNMTPLMLACMSSCFEAFSRLCEHPDTDFNCRDKNGWTALHFPFLSKSKKKKVNSNREMDFDAKKKILEKIFHPDSSEFDVEVLDDEGRNILEFVLMANKFDCRAWELFLKHPLIPRMMNETKDKEGYTLIYQAIVFNKLDTVDFLLKFPGLSLHLVDGKNIVQFAIDRWIAEAETQGVEKCLRVFSEHPEVREMLNTKNQEGDPPVIKLLKDRRLDLVNILLESPEIDLDVRDSAGKNLETIAR